MLANNAFGIDLGTRTIKIYSAHSDTVTVEKNMIAIENISKAESPYANKFFLFSIAIMFFSTVTVSL